MPSSDEESEWEVVCPAASCERLGVGRTQVSEGVAASGVSAPRATRRVHAGGALSSRTDPQPTQEPWVARAAGYRRGSPGIRAAAVGVGSTRNVTVVLASPTGARCLSPIRRYAVWSTSDGDLQWRGIHVGRGRAAYDALQERGVGRDCRRAFPPADTLDDAIALYRTRVAVGEIPFFEWRLCQSQWPSCSS
jgi:hypothetical protein